VDSIQAYIYRFNNVNHLQELEYQQTIEYRQASTTVFDVFVFEKMLKGLRIVMPEGNPALLSYKKEDINKMLIHIHSLKRNRLLQVQIFTGLKAQGSRLISLLKKEYQL
jgi:hypothetical protein